MRWGFPLLAASLLLFPACALDKHCGTGTSECGGACVDTRADAAHCGACGNVCPSGSCVGGACPFLPCRGDEVVCLGADSGVVTGPGGSVTKWTDQSPNHYDATTVSSGGPVLATAVVNGKSRSVLRFDGSGFLTAPPHVPAKGTIFLVVSNRAPRGHTSVIGWEDANIGNHGVGIAPNYGPGDPPGILLVVARYSSGVDYGIGDVGIGPMIDELEVVTVTWGENGTTLERRRANGDALTAPVNAAITSVSDGGFTLHIGSPGDDRSGFRFNGDLAALRVFDSQLAATDRTAIASTLYDYWIK